MFLSILKDKNKNTVTVKKKVKVVKAAESVVLVREGQWSNLTVVDTAIINFKEAILELYESNDSGSSICMRKRA